MKRNQIGLFPRSTFTAFRNSDHLFTGDVADFIHNRYQGHICFADGDQDGDQAGGDQAGGDDDKVTISKSELASLVAGEVARITGSSGDGDQGDDDQDDKKSPSDKAKKRQEEKQKRQDQRNADQALALDNVAFDSYIKDNAGFFPESVQTIRADATEEVGEDLDKLVPLLHAGAARLFFEKEANLEPLDTADQDYIKNKILKTRYDSQIDHAQAWKLVKMSIHNQNLINDNHQRRMGGKKGNGAFGKPALDKRIDNWFPKSVQDTTEAD